jgi:precorrin-6B methylase 1
MSCLREFLTNLSIDPGKLSQFLRDPKASMDAAGIDEFSRRTLFGGSAQAMWDLILGRDPVDSTQHPPTLSFEADQRASLIVVGTGICTVGQLTLAAISYIRESSAVFYLVADPIAEDAIRQLSPNAVSLKGHYGEGKHRKDSYEAMVDQILTSVRAGNQTCAAFYGHPGVFAYPSHESIRRARQEGYLARMLPGISAEDCLFADLGVDPAVNGCQSFEATDFLLHDRVVDTSCQLILWQLGVVGDVTYCSAGYNVEAVFPLLISRLCELYGEGHVATVYEAGILPGLAPVITQVALDSLTPAHVTAGSTLYIPPARESTVNRTMAAAMGREY